MKNASSTSFRQSAHSLALAASCGLAFVAAYPTALSAQVTGRDPIIVDGERLTPAVARDRALGFMRSTGVAAGETPAARWTDPVCPRVLGLTPEGGRAAEGMIRQVAADVGIEAADEPCDSNIVIMFTRDAGAVVRQIARLEPRRLADLDPGVREEVVNGSAPIRWWHTSEQRGRHGGNGRSDATSAARTASAVRGPGATPGSDLAAGVPTMLHYENSIISTLTTRVLTSATVVIDQDAIMGRRLSQVAAYAALVAFAEIRPASPGIEGSILGMFGSESPPLRLTTQDVGFLQTLYRIPLDRQARHHRGLLVGGMVSAAAAQVTN